MVNKVLEYYFNNNILKDYGYYIVIVNLFLIMHMLKKHYTF